MPYRFLTRCVETSADKLEAMYARERPITFATARRHIGQAHLNEVFPFYATGPLTLAKDRYVEYSTSWFEGRPCINIEHSRIDYIFLKEDLPRGKSTA
ncbi:MAG: hypothetical protein Q8S75_01290 [Nitrospirota bacterium]|jgi:hypothetical protein|nr:hypothetical protein [Nitrospirota bacterium]